MAAPKEAKTKVSGKKRKQRQDKLENLSEFTEVIIKYFQDGLLLKLTVKNENSKIIMKSFKLNDV